MPRPRRDQYFKAEAIWRWMTGRKPAPRPVSHQAHEARLRALDILLSEYNWDTDGFGTYTDGFSHSDHKKAIDWLAKNGYVRRGRAKTSPNYGYNYIHVTSLGREAQRTRKFGADPLPKSERKERESWTRKT